MLVLRPGPERGYADHGWLQSWHSFSFAGYYDERHMGWGNLRVINEDRVAAGQGFGRHGHRDMEIISYVLAGQLAHQDSMGNTATIRAGELQRMSAGSGVQHSEFNPAPAQSSHFLQIWLEPARQGIAPEYEQKSLAAADRRGVLQLLASPDGAQGALRLNADASLYAGLFEGNEQARLALDPQRKAYVHLVRGQLQANGQQLRGGDALLLADESTLLLEQGRDAEVLVFDLAP